MQISIKTQIRNLGCHILGTNTEKEYTVIINLDSPETFKKFTDQKLEDLFLHAYHHTKYYYEIFNQIGLIQDNHVDLSKMQKIPLLTKDIIRERFKDLISDDYHKRGWFYNSSGGSTGEPIKLIQDKHFLKWAKTTNNYYYRNIVGIDEPNVKKVIIWGSERDLFQGTIGIKATLLNWISNTVKLNSFKMKENDIQKYIRVINTFKPDFIRGYAGSLYEICRYAEKHNLALFTPKVIESAAETINGDMRDQIERVFQTKIYNFYGSREVSNLAGECSHGLMHFFQFWNYQELLDENDHPVSIGEQGKVIVTNLFNYSMPLIRYDIGDTAILGPEKCQCGNILPTYKKVTGRITDHFYLKDGSMVPAEFFIHLLGVVCYENYIQKFQVIQEDYEIIKIMTVISKEIPEIYKKDIEDKIRVVMGDNCKIIWGIVDDIPKTPSGKYLYTKSLIKK